MSQIESGKGTKFTVITSHRIALETDFDNSKADHEVSAIFSGKRILLAEDNDLNAEIAMEILSEMGLEVERAEDGDLCIDMMKQSKEGYYDLILMDIQKLMETLTDIL
ncbi:response regulator [Clostridiales bacterium]|jgi:BarA-like signal transduction histidine kinase|nr:response regulator [Clostridiales bacterium]